MMSEFSGRSWKLSSLSKIDETGSPGIAEKLKLYRQMQTCLLNTSQMTSQRTRNRKHRQAAAKPAACAKPLMLSTLGSKAKREEV